MSDSALTMTDSIVSANTATSAAGGICINTPATVNLTNVTISGNTATTLYGGGVYILGGGIANLTNVTISGNTAPDAGGVLTAGAGMTNILYSTIANNHKTSGTVGGVHNYATMNIRNSIVAGNDGDECGINGFTQPSDHPSTNPLLGPLANNGGPTQTHALLSGSPAIDAGTNIDCPSKDQRGLSRPQGAYCDIGAYEYAIYKLFLPLLLR